MLMWFVQIARVFKPNIELKKTKKQIKTKISTILTAILAPGRQNLQILIKKSESTQKNQY